METVSERAGVPLELVTTGQPLGRSPLRRRRILVVADEADVAQLIRDNLLSEGWDIFTTDAAADVLAHARDVRPDVILLDITGPQFDGWGIYRRLKDDQETRAIRVIMVAARFEKGHTVLASEASADAIVILP